MSLALRYGFTRSGTFAFGLVGTLDFAWAGSTQVRQQLVEKFTDILAGRKIS